MKKNEQFFIQIVHKNENLHKMDKKNKIFEHLKDRKLKF